MLRCLQARALRSELAQLNLPPDTLWVTSPLSRAIETLLLACPTAHLLRQAAGSSSASGASCSGASGSGSAENSAAAPNGGSERPPCVQVLPAISEKVGRLGTRRLWKWGAGSAAPGDEAWSAWLCGSCNLLLPLLPPAHGPSSQSAAPLNDRPRRW